MGGQHWPRTSDGCTAWDSMAQPWALSGACMHVCCPHTRPLRYRPAPARQNTSRAALAPPGCLQGPRVHARAERLSERWCGSCQTPHAPPPLHPRPRGPTLCRLPNLRVLTDHRGDRAALHTRTHSDSKTYTHLIACVSLRAKPKVLHALRARYGNCKLKTLECSTHVQSAMTCTCLL